MIISGVQAADALSNLANAIVASTNPSATTLTANAWNVITATAACNAKLPTPVAGKVIGVRIENASTNLFTLNPNASEKIQPGANTSRIMWAGESAILVSNGTDWIKIAGLSIPMKCKLLASAQQTLTHAAFTKSSLPTVDLDNTGLMADTANSGIKIKRGGDYMLACFGNCGANGASQPFILSASTDGSTEFRRLARGPSDSGNSWEASAGGFLQGLTTSQEFYLLVYCGATADQLNYYTSPSDVTNLALTEVPQW